MKIQLDTQAKSIKLEQNAKLIDVIDFLKKILPDEWKEYTIETNTVIYNWTTPYYYRSYPYYSPGTINPNPIITTAGNGLTFTNQGVRTTTGGGAAVGNTVTYKNDTPHTLTANGGKKNLYNFEVQN